MADIKLILVIGGTGAQGISVVKASEQATKLAALPNVTLLQVSQDNQKDLHTAFAGVYGAWVNLDGFTIGEKSELFYGVRAYEIARHHGVKHYTFANTDYALRKAGWDEGYHWGHNDAKGRVADLILSHGQATMKTSILTTGPYMDMVFDGMFVPEEQADGSFVWENPADIRHPSESAGVDLEVATDQVSFTEIAATFTEVTGKQGIHRRIPLEKYLEKAEPYPGAY
ncbi:hypothetical protein PoHVEF18_010113 [Penicillium ochrochloron]